MKFYQKASFLKTQKQYYQLLKASGFEDIEFTYPDGNSSHFTTGWKPVDIPIDPTGQPYSFDNDEEPPSQADRWFYDKLESSPLQNPNCNYYTQAGKWFYDQLEDSPTSFSNLQIQIIESHLWGNSYRHIAKLLNISNDKSWSVVSSFKKSFFKWFKAQK